MSGFQPTAPIRIRPCIGSLMDIPAGEYHTGQYGDKILNGGFSNFIGVGGRGNTFKTALLMSTSMIVLDRYAPHASMVQYDTELTATWDRMRQISKRLCSVFDFDQAVEDGKIMLTSRAEHSGNEWWRLVREESQERAKNAKKECLKSPFLRSKDKFVYAFPPRIHFLDSLSSLNTDAIDAIHDKSEIDDSSATTDFMRSAAIKTRLVEQIPAVTTAGGLQLLTTAHLGDEIKTDPYAPSTQKLKFVKKGLKFKNVPEKFTFYASLCWVITDIAPLINRNTKASEYPLEGFGDSAGETDLQELTMVNARSKHGGSGHIFKLIVSQSEGLLPGLSEFHFLKSRKDKFGLLGPEGVGKDYRLSLYPEALLKRTQVRKIIQDNPRIKRALEITTEMCQIYEYWVEFPNEEKITPEELYKGLKEQGYDWNRLLDTRGYWVFDHYDHSVPPLSTMDLINMYFKRYTPFWYKTS